MDKIDAAGLVKVATFTRETLVYLGEREAPMTSTLGAGTKPAQPAAGAGRRVSLGTMPDFAFAGPGVKVNSVIEGSPAAAAGVQAGDILLAIDDAELKDLRSFVGFRQPNALASRSLSSSHQSHTPRGLRANVLKTIELSWPCSIATPA